MRNFAVAAGEKRDHAEEPVSLSPEVSNQKDGATEPMYGNSSFNSVRLMNIFLKNAWWWIGFR